MLLTSQGTPMILAGDEFGNTQMGNNNAYCHDDEVTWLNWNKTKRSESIFTFVKNMIAMRKSFRVFRQDHPLQMMDTLSCGMPDLSMHGDRIIRITAECLVCFIMEHILLSGMVVRYI